MLTPHRVLEDAMERGNLPVDVRAELRENFGCAQLLFQLEDMGVDLEELEVDSDTEFVERDDDVLPPGYYVNQDPEMILVYANDDQLAFPVTRNTSDAHINHLAWEHHLYGPTPVKESA